MKLIEVIKNVIKNVSVDKKESEKIMTNQTTQQPKKYHGSLVTYVYGQLYRGYLESEKATKFKITNINVRKWEKILGWLKKHEYIVSFELGKTIETACELEVEGFNGNNLLYTGYLKSIERNMKNEKIA